jgi:hypothetical protein
MRFGTFASFLLSVGLATAGTVTYTSSAAFEGATTVNAIENYGSGFSNGEDLSTGFSADGITYSGFVLTSGATLLDITNQYDSLSGLSLGADHTAASGPAFTYFLGGEGATLTFNIPVTAFGMFFNVNPNSGTYGFTSSVGTASTDSVAYDTGTFVFAGLISTTPFSSVTFSSTGAAAVYNVPELLATTTAVPEPATIGLALVGGLLLAARKFAGRN